MSQKQNLSQGIPVSPSLAANQEIENKASKDMQGKKRLIYISFLTVVIAALVSLIAKFLVFLIYLVTNLSFYGKFSIAHATPMDNHLGWGVVIIPALGGIIIGLMAYYGSKAIRGHGIPEAMEQILTNDSKINPAITYLKPISSAIAIGTGGPFGAEGPIIATGGALGSTLGQMLHISHNERKVLLAAGATAGMSAIFGSPIAGIFLAIELLLFEFSAASIIPVAFACITGAAGHYLLFEGGPVFPVGHIIEAASTQALVVYSAIGILTGLLSVGVTKFVYYAEDLFERLPVHWIWWPALGGIAVGVVGYFNPRTLGVGYYNITDVLSGSLAIQTILLLCILKFVSWAIALSSGTSGGTLAPLLTIGGAAGALMGYAAQRLFPGINISISMAALTGMAAMFAGASRALLTSIIFAVETTGQINALLPLLASCSLAYFVSVFLMTNTIMTEKIARRGIKTPDVYKPDLLEQITVKEVMDKNGLIMNEENSIASALATIQKNGLLPVNYFVLVNRDGKYTGMAPISQLHENDNDTTISNLAKTKNIFLKPTDTLAIAVSLMSKENVDILPVLGNNYTVSGTVSYKNVFDAYQISMSKHLQVAPNVSIRNAGKLLLKGRPAVTSDKG